MKKKYYLMTLAIILLLGVTACGTKKESQEANDDKIITVASALDSSEKILSIANEEAKKQGYTIEMVRVNDNVQYNTLLNNKEVDANFSQHEPFMEEYNAANNGNLVMVQKVYDARVGFYSKEYTDLADIPDGQKVALPNDVSNQGRALAILESNGLIGLKEGVGFDGTVKDITDNPHKFEFVEIDLLNLASAYDEKGMALVYNYPTYLTKIGLTPDDAILLEKPNDGRYAISVAAREDNASTEKIKVLKESVGSDAVRDYLEKEESVALVPSF